MIILPISSVHAGVVAELHSVSFGEDWPEDQVAAMLATPGAFGFIANLEDEPAGFVACRASGDECELLSIGVIPAWRRTGLAQGLWESAITEARRRAVGNLYLEVAEDNLPAISFYTTNGCKNYGSRKSYYRRLAGRVDGLLFRLALD
ncbi:MAG: GNAT family N-acetyltransferase [Rhodospirillaceae bacterium]|jgi:ribosomal-protein-alanine N-acetyltransferase